MRTLFLFLFSTVCFHAYSQVLSPKEEQAFAKLDFSVAEKKMEDSYGAPVKIEVDQSSLAGDLAAIPYADTRGARTVANVIARLCTEASTLQALQNKKITTVLIRNIREGKYRVEIKEGTLTLFSGLSSEHNYFGELELRYALQRML